MKSHSTTSRVSAPSLQSFFKKVLSNSFLKVNSCKKKLFRIFKTKFFLSLKDSLTCPQCGKAFTRKDMLARHISSHGNTTFTCEICNKQFTRKDNMIAHRRIHERPGIPCTECSESFSSLFNLNQHKRTQHQNPPIIKKRKSVQPRRSRALNVFSSTYFHPEEESSVDISIFQKSITSKLANTLQSEILEQGAIKWYTVLKILFEKKTVNGDIETIDGYFKSNVKTQLSNQLLEENIEEAFTKMKKSVEEFLQRGSGWTIKEIRHLELCCAKYHPLRASSFIQLPKELLAKKAILNIQNFEDNKCLIWCLLAHKMQITRTEEPQRVSHYKPHEDEIQMGNVKCPVAWQDIPLIEKLNNLRINVFIYQEKEVCPLYISKKDNEDCINLLLIENEDGGTHYTLIRSFSRLMGNLTRHDPQVFYCYRCLHRYSRQDLLEAHQKDCRDHPIQAIKMPKEEKSTLKFTSTFMQHPVPYIIYADFESIILPVSTAQPSTMYSFNQKVAKHIPCGYAYMVVGPDSKAVKPVKCYRGEDAVQHFIKSIIQEKEELKPILTTPKPLKLTVEEQEEFDAATICHICEKPMNPEEKRRDHCHVTGSYRGASHNSCNLNFKVPSTIPIIFHNLKNYDAHHIMLEIGKFKEYDLSIIPTTLEKYISFKMIKQGCPLQLVFLDSLQFLPASLEKLVKNMSVEDFHLLKENAPCNLPLELLTRKGVYPYSYISSFKIFEETQLPPPSAFFNNLTEEDITEEDYQHAQHVWNLASIRNLGEYHDFYVKLDVVLLADVFQNFRHLCLKYYKIDPAHVYTAPGLSWQACLKMTQVELTLLTDIDMLLFIEKGVRGGVCQISKRYARANNIYMKEQYDASKESSYIIYLDSNNLYGYAMSQYLPCGDFEWEEEKFKDVKQAENFIKSLTNTEDYGYILEVNLEYPADLHDLHDEYPLAPERITVREDMLSEYAKSTLTNGKYSTVPKLILNLNSKKNYVLHYRTLKLYLNLGLKLIHVHRALKFRQSPWLAEYINFNTEKRKAATSSFEKDFFKLLNNSIYGKTIENLRKRRNIELCNQEIRAEKLTACPSFTNFKIFSEDLVAVERVKMTILMNRPIYVGFSILELSKELMYEFHYNHFKKAFKKASLLFTDTDSLTYFVETKDIYEDFKKHSMHYDFSDYPKGEEGHFLHSNTNKKVVGKFKDELNSQIIHEFIGLKPKMYSILSEEKKEMKKAKGVSSRVVKNKLRHADYYNCLFNSNVKYFEIQRRIGQENHQLFTFHQNKVTLSSFDDKRYILEDGISSLAYGNYRISS